MVEINSGKMFYMPWQYILSKTTTDDSWASFLHNPIWYNNKLKINHTCFFYKDWYRKGVRIVNELAKEDGEFYSFEEFERNYNINTNFLKYHRFISCLKKYSEKFNKDNVSKIEYPYIARNIKVFLKSKKGTRDMYAILSKNHLQPTIKQKLMTMFELTENDIKQIYKLPFKTTKNCKFQWLQYRIKHLRLTTNTFLYKIKIKQDPLCSFCKKENENMIHLLWECENVQILLEALDNWTLN
jgi:hypothetical protein